MVVNEAVATRARVLFVTHSSVLSGAELALLTVMPALRACGVEPVLCVAVAGPVASRAAEQGFAVEVLELSDRLVSHRRAAVNPLVDPLRLAPDVVGAARKVAAVAARSRASLVCAMSMKAFLYASLGSRLAGLPLVWDVHDIARPPYLTPAAALVFRLLRLTMRPRAVLVHSKAVAETISGRSRVVVIPNAIRAGRTTAAVADSGPIRFGMAARLTPWKGQLVAIRAMAEVVRRVPNAELWLAGAPLFGVGEEQYARDLESEAARLGIRANVRLLGHVDDPVAFYESVDVGLQCATAPEPFGITVLDAMVAGRPVVVSDHGGVVELLGTPEAGSKVRPDDPSALAQVMLELAGAGRSELRRRGAEARRRAATYDVSVVGPVLADFFVSQAR